MARQNRWVVLGCILAAVVLGSSSIAAPTTWNAGDEKAWTGHTFGEEYWTASVTNRTQDGANVTFSVSYVDAGAVEAFLVAFNQWEKNDSRFTLPYQLFGMHYFSHEGKEVFLGAVFAFLMAFNDTYTTGSGNGLPNPGNEDVYYVLPLGVAKDFTNSSYPPSAAAIPATKLAEGHYQFGISYKNLYAKIIGANTPGEFWLSTLLPVYIARFSELTVTYDLKVDATTHVATAETFYTIGEIQDLWLWGQRVDPHQMNATWGLAAVHYGVVITSNYTVEGADGTRLGANFEGPAGDSLTLKIGGSERFARIGFRGTFDLYDEPAAGASGSPALVSADNPAYNAIVKARLTDRGLVKWQHDLSADLMSVFAYGSSASIGLNYTSPQDLRSRGAEQFRGAAFWYAVSFPHWGGWRVVHDPTYEAYYSVQAPPPAPARGLSGFELPLAIGAIAVAAAGFAALERRRK